MRTLLTTLHSKFIHPSLALPCLAAFCGEECGNLLIREFTVHEPRENVLTALLAENPDVVAFSVYLWNRRETLELVDALAVARPGLRLVLGGPEVSFEEESFFARHPGLTALVRGEGELPLRALLLDWASGREPDEIPRLAIRRGERVVEGPDGPVIADLGSIPSPFAAGLVDTSRGFVYLETSRGCPYDCAFCMSALDDRVRSFSLARIEADLLWLMEREVPKVKLVDRTFNYDARRAREIFAFILTHNRSTHFHFEIGAQLLDEETLGLLERVPEEMFQFEIGVQSTLPATLAAIGRKAALDKIEASVRALRERTRIHLHLDLIAGLPGEDYPTFLASIDRVLDWRPHHLQVEPVKLLPGAPLRRRAEEFALRFDPNPPYTVLGTPDLSFDQLARLRGLSRLLDLTVNSGRLGACLAVLAGLRGGVAAALEHLTTWWQSQGLFRHPLGQEAIFLSVWDYLRQSFAGEDLDRLRLALGLDFARSERVVPGRAPAFLDTDLTANEEQGVRERVRTETEAIRGQGLKLQHFAGVFANRQGGRQIILFIYLTGTGKGLRILEVEL